MSQVGATIDAIEAAVRTSQAGLPGGIPELPGGDAGFERELRKGSELPEGHIPHVFAHNPITEREPLEWQQATERFAVQLDFWTRGETQNDVIERLEAARTAILADRTLGGLWEELEVTTTDTRDFADGRIERAGLLIVEAGRVV